MIRTLHVINGLGTGGAERSLAELLPDLPARGVEPAVAVFHRRPEGIEEQVRASGITIHHVRATGLVPRVRAVLRLVHDLDADVVHSTLFEADVVGRLAAAGTRASVLTSLVNTSYEPVRLLDANVRRSRLRGAQLVDAATARIGHQHFHAITDAVRRSAVRRLRIPADRITVVPRGRRRSRLGEPDEARRARVRERFGVPPDARMALHVGREEYQKGHEVLLEAVSPLLARFPDLVLVMAGRRGNASSAVDERLVTLPTERVRRLGHVEYVPDLLAAADLFVFPSHYEGLGGAALEAMAMAVPIVASDLPALREFLDGVARFARPGSSADLAAGVEAVLNDPAGAGDRARAGRHRFDGAYEHQHVVTAMADLLRSVARHRTR